MSTHSYTRLWTHLIWETLNREPMLDKRAVAKASSFLNDYSRRHGIYMKINYFNADHTHVLIDLPTKYSIEEVIKLLKGGSSYWINHSRIINIDESIQKLGLNRPMESRDSRMSRELSLQGIEGQFRHKFRLVNQAQKTRRLVRSIG